MYSCVFVQLIILTNRSCKVLTSFCAMAKLLNIKANIDGLILKVTWAAKRM
jgi:hypothetical protein